MRASVPPTLILRTPRSAASTTVMNGALASRFTGLGATASTTADTCSAVANARRVEAVRSGLRVSLQPADRLLEIRPARDEPLGAARENDARAALVDRLSRRPNPLDGEVEGVERLAGIACRILDRQPGDAGRGGELHVHRDAVRIARETVLEVRIHRDIHGVRDLTKMLERLVAPHAVVGAGERPGVPGARRRQRLEAHLLERDGGAGVPRVRHHEAALGVQAVKGLDLLALRRHAANNRLSAARCGAHARRSASAKRR